MGALAIPLMIGGTILNAYGQVQQGRAAAALGTQQRVAKDFEAQQLEQQAGQEIASGQAAAQEESRKAAYASSHALALAAASGGGATDPTVTKIISDIAGEGTYRGEVARYRGAEAARQLNMRAGATRYEGQLEEIGGLQKQQAANIKATGSLIEGGSTLYTKYGMGGPNPSVVDTAPTNPNDPYGLRSAAKNYYG